MIEWNVKVKSFDKTYTDSQFNYQMLGEHPLSVTLADLRHPRWRRLGVTLGK